MAKIASNVASNVIFCYGRNFFLAVRSGFNRFLQHGGQVSHVVYALVISRFLSRFCEFFLLILVSFYSRHNPLGRSSSRMTAHSSSRARSSTSRRLSAVSSPIVDCSSSSTAFTAHDLSDRRRPSSSLCCCYSAASRTTRVRLHRRPSVC